MFSKPLETHLVRPGESSPSQQAISPKGRPFAPKPSVPDEKISRRAQVKGFIVSFHYCCMLIHLFVVSKQKNDL